MARLERRQLLRLLLPRGGWWLLRRMVILPVSLSFRRPLPDGLGCWWGCLFFPILLLLLLLLTLLPKLFAWLHPFLLRTEDGKINTRTTKREQKEIRKGKLTTTRVFVQPTSYRRRLWTPIVCVQRVESNQVSTLLLLERDIKNPTYKSLLLVRYTQ